MSDAAIYRYDGDRWQNTLQGLTTYTPTYTNIILGTGGQIQTAYTITDHVASVSGRLIFGVGGLPYGAGINVSLPPGLHPAFINDLGHPVGIRQIGSAIYFDESTGVAHFGGVDINAYNPFAVVFYTASTPFYVTSTTPFTWSVNDEIYWRITYDLILHAPPLPPLPPATPPPAMWDITAWDQSIWI